MLFKNYKISCIHTYFSILYHRKLKKKKKGNKAEKKMNIYTCMCVFTSLPVYNKYRQILGEREYRQKDTKGDLQRQVHSKEEKQKSGNLQRERQQPGGL